MSEARGRKGDIIDCRDMVCLGAACISASGHELSCDYLLYSFSVPGGQVRLYRTGGYQFRRWMIECGQAYLRTVPLSSTLKTEFGEMDTIAPALCRNRYRGSAVHGMAWHSGLGYYINTVPGRQVSRDHINSRLSATVALRVVAPRLDSSATTLPGLDHDSITPIGSDYEDP